MSTVLITGGTGMIGSALSQLLIRSGYNVIILSRNPLETAARDPFQYGRTSFRSSGNLYYARWDLKKNVIDLSALAEADYIVHLAGAGAAEKRWTKRRKEEILRSRTESSALLIKMLRDHKHKVKTLVSASAIGWYGPDKGSAFRESDPPGNDFLGRTCLEWERSIDPVAEMGIRLVKLRSGIVLSRSGGALREFLKPVRMGIGAILGTGKQVTSWIHIDDLCRAYLEAIENPGMQGVYNVVAPKPVDNETITLTIARQLKGKSFIPVHVPEWLLKAIFGELSVEVLKSATVDSEKIRQTGFQFAFPSIESAINDLLKK